MYYIKTLIYGLPGAGKTYLSATMPKPLFLLTEGDVSLPSLYRAQHDLGLDLQLEKSVIHIRSKQQFEDVTNEVVGLAVAGKLPYESVVLDSLTDLQGQVQQDMLAGGDKPRYFVRLDEWGTLLNMTEFLLRQVRNAPVNVLVTALMELQRNDTLPAPRIQPRGLALRAPALFNLVGMLGAKTVQQGETTRTSRVLYLDPDPLEGVCVAKNTGGFLPGVIVNPNMTVIIQAAQEAMASLMGKEK